MATTMTTVDAILKEIYGPRIEDQLQSEMTALKRIERTSDGIVETEGGKYVDFPIRVGRNHGMGYRNENEALPAAGAQKYAEVHVGLKYGYGRVRFTSQVMRLAKSKPQAFANAVNREMEGLKDDLRKDQNRIIYGDGTGLMASLTGVETGTTPKAVDNAQRLEEGMIVDVLTRSTGAVVSAGNEITAVNVDTDTVTFATGFTAAATAGIYRAGSYNREPSGLGVIVDDTAVLFGLDPATQPKWKAVVNDNGGTPRALSESLMTKTDDDVRTKGGNVSLILTSLGVRRAYFNLLSQQRRYTNTKEFAGGFTGLAFNNGREIPVVEDVDAPASQMLFLTESKIKKHRDQPWHWADEDGNVLKWVNDYDAFEGFMREFSEFSTIQRNAHGKLADLIEA